MILSEPLISIRLYLPPFIEFFLFRNEFKKPVDQTRTSKLNNFLLKKDVFEKDQKALEEYRAKFNPFILISY